MNHLEKYFDQKNIDNKVVVATDAGSSKKAHKYAKYFNCPIALIDKRRDDNDDNAIATTVIGNIKGKNALISRLLRYDSLCEIIEPLICREDMIKIIKQTLSNYGV